MAMCARKASSLELVTQDILDDDAGFKALRGYKLGHPNLTISEYVDWEKRDEQEQVKASYAIAFFRRSIPVGSPVETSILAGFLAKDFAKMYFDFIDFAEGQQMCTALAHATAIINVILNVAATQSALATIDLMSKHEAEFYKLLSVSECQEPEVQAQFNVRLIRAQKLWSFLLKIALVELSAIDKEHICSFIMKEIRESLVDPSLFNIDA